MADCFILTKHCSRFVGYPNAGKSTLLSMISRTSPAISPVPFTTVHPQIGTVVFDDGRSFTVADLPGLIEGSHIKMGLGSRFLKHTLRSKILLFVVDINGFQLDFRSPIRTAFDAVVFLTKELEMYEPNLLKKRAVLAINKIDQLDDRQKILEFYHYLDNAKQVLENDYEEKWRPTRLFHFDDIVEIAGKHGTHCDRLCSILRRVLDDQASEDKSNRRSSSFSSSF